MLSIENKGLIVYGVVKKEVIGVNDEIVRAK